MGDKSRKLTTYAKNNSGDTFKLRKAPFKTTSRPTKKILANLWRVCWKLTTVISATTKWLPPLSDTAYDIVPDQFENNTY